MTVREPVLLLHGQPGSAHDWDRVVTAIGGRLDAIAIDRPGWGGVGAPSGLEGNARAAVAALDARGLRRATVVGHSLGGAVAAWLAVHRPERVGALVLSAPSANVASLSWVDGLLAARAVGQVASAAALGGLGVALRARPLRHRIAGKTGVDERYLEHSGELLLRPSSWRAFVREQRALVREVPALELRLDRIRAPTTIVAGSDDPIVPIAASRLLAEQITGAELVVLRGAGHLLPLQHAGRLVEVIVAASGRTLGAAVR